MFIARLDRCHQLRDRLRLIALRLVIGCELKKHVQPETNARKSATVSSSNRVTTR